MKSLALVCALAIASAYVLIVGAQWISLENGELQPHESTRIGCGRDKYRQIKNLMKEMECKPRYTLMKLIPQPGFAYYPDYVPVMRCQGNCPKAMSCMPMATRTKKIVVRMDGYYSSNCYHVSVEEHLECKCSCSVQERHCSQAQVYSEDNCACVCKERQECDETRQMIWDAKSCKCICNREETCSSGLVWVPALCGCAKVVEMAIPR